MWLLLKGGSGKRRGQRDNKTNKKILVTMMTTKKTEGKKNEDAGRGRGNAEAVGFPCPALPSRHRTAKE